MGDETISGSTTSATRTTTRPQRLGRPAAFGSRLSAALLNASGLSAGYFYLRLWRRGLTHPAVTIGLLILAASGNAASRPGPWIALFAAWIAWMIWDGWRQGRRLFPEWTLAAQRRSPWPIVAGGLLIVLSVVAFTQYRAAGTRAFAAGLDHHRAADCRGAIDRYARVTTFYELTLSPLVASADANLSECEVFLSGTDAQGRDNFVDAVSGYHAYQRQYPNGLLAGTVRSRLAETYNAWAVALRKENKYGDAIAVYVSFLRDLPDTPLTVEVPHAMIDAYNEAIRPLSERRFCDAVPVLDTFAGLKETEAEPVATMARGTLPQTLYDCGLERYNSAQYADAIGYLERLARDHADSPLVGQAQALLIAARVAQIKGGQTGALPPPQAVGRAPGGDVLVEVVNDSPGELEVLASGPSATATMVAPCPECSVYSTPASPSCEKTGSKPTVTLRLAPGSYDVVVRVKSDTGVTPYSGVWQLSNGTRYSNCFYIVQTRYGHLPYVPRIPLPPLIEPVEPRS